MSLFAKDLTFYELLEAQAMSATRAAQAFLTLTEDFTHIAEHAQTIKEIEHEGDQVIHQLSNRIDASFITPLDKEDLHALANRIDDVTDAIEAAAARLPLYRLDALRPDLKTIVDLIVRITQAIQEAVSGLRDLHRPAALQAALARVHELESEGDYHFRQALADLFNAPDPDPMTVIKWKDIYERAEKAVDYCEEVANVIEAIMVKYA